jgi:hypothetical protein
MSKKLIVIEGFDRCGKDTLMSDLSKQNNDFYIYGNDLTGLPKYDKEQEEFLVWLNKFINKQVNDLNELFKTYDTIVMCRLLVSDEVYSTLFNREHTTIKYMDKLKDVEIIHYCLLFNDYNEYINRLKKIGDNIIQYDENHFNMINQLYIDTLNSLNYKYHINYVYSYNSRRNILENFYKYYDKIK